MNDAELIQLADKLARAMPRHPDVLALRDAICERLAIAPSHHMPGPKPPRPYTRAEYMRLYMRAYRIKHRANPFA